MRAYFIFVVYIIFGNTCLSAQGCSDFYYFRKDTEVVFLHYDAKGNVSGKDIGNTRNINKGENMALSEYPTITYNADSKTKAEFSQQVFCINNNLKINFPVSDIPGFTISLSYPSEMKIGQEIGKDVRKSFKMRVGDKETDILFSITNRKVIGQETVKTSAGEFKSEKIQYNLNFEYNIAGISIPLQKKIWEWFSPGYGIVKTEFYTKDGILEKASVLSSVN
ncbi:hypothetical protein CEY12_01855 [Chryseobacterium sp. T16E-39]|nr:hypothetical protein CEY12_01855 [Chryseobacterium sp. T16E-39]